MSVSMQMILYYTPQSTMIRTGFFFIDSLHEWSSTNKMPFNTAKCEVRAFNSRESLPPSYKIGEHSLNYVDEIKYLGVVMQSNLKFNRHIASKVNSAKKVHSK